MKYKQALPEDVLDTEMTLPLAVKPIHLAESIVEMLSPESNPDADFKRTIAFISELEKSFHTLDLTVALANHFIRAVRENYESDSEHFNFEEVFAEGLKSR